ncbi:MAG: DUF4738 domain-containing protein [Bacteroidaceae bacterium]|nr:DUF4738 domain-containing protein [Bacteroidaceae bacterium]
MIFRYVSAVIVSVAVIVTVAACGFNHPASESENADENQSSSIDTTAMRMLAGVWVDEDTGAAVLRICDDSIFYADSLALPSRFVICADTMIVMGAEEQHYPIEQISDEVFYYMTLTGESIHLIRSFDDSDALAFSSSQPDAIEMDAVELDRDTVMYSPAGKRFHLYVKVNPSQNKVYSTSYTEEGMAVRTAYYDNIVHIGVFDGSERVCSRDFSKNDFADESIPASFMESAILYNIEFGYIDNRGVHFQAVLTQPEGYTSYLADITVSFTGDISITHPE